jgi:hypothetical protein
MGDWFEPAVELATLDIYEQNAFRRLEMPVEATSRELVRRRDLMQRAINTDLPIPPGVGRILALPSAPDIHELQHTEHTLQNAERRLAHEFFWFWPLTPGTTRSDPALCALIAGEGNQALKLWREQLNTSGPARAAARHNLALLHHLFALKFEQALLDGTKVSVNEADKHWEAATRYWNEVLNDEDVWGHVSARIRDIDDPSLPTGASRRLRKTLTAVLALIDAKLVLRALEQKQLDLAERHAQRVRTSPLPHNEAQDALGQALEPQRSQITTLADTARSNGEADPVNADKILEVFLDQAGELLRPFDILLDLDHHARQAEHDKIAQTALSLAIDYGNKTNDWQRTLTQLDLVIPIALGTAVKERIATNRSTVKTNLEADKCWFCKERSATMGSSIKVKMHGDVKRTPTYQGTQITWSKITVSVPQCDECDRMKKRLGKQVWISVFIVTFLITFLSICFDHGHFDDELAVGATILGSVIGMMVGALSSIFAVAMRFGSEKSHPKIKELCSQGWNFGDEPQS